MATPQAHAHTLHKPMPATATSDPAFEASVSPGAADQAPPINPAPRTFGLVQALPMVQNAHRNPGLRKYLRKLGYTTATSLAVTGISAAVFTTGVLPTPHSSTAMLLITMGGLFGSMAVVVYTPPIRRTDEEGHPVTYNRRRRIIAQQVLNVSVGAMISPLLLIFSPHTLFSGALITAGMTAGLVAYARSQPQGHMVTWGPVLYGGLCSLALIQLGGLTVMLFAPPASALTFFSVVDWLDILVGIPLFSGLVMYDMSKATYRYTVFGSADHIGDSVSLYLDVLNIFLRVSQLVDRATN